MKKLLKLLTRLFKKKEADIDWEYEEYLADLHDPLDREPDINDDIDCVNPEDVFGGIITGGGEPINPEDIFRDEKPEKPMRIKDLERDYPRLAEIAKDRREEYIEDRPHQPHASGEEEEELPLIHAFDFQYTLEGRVFWNAIVAKDFDFAKWLDFAPFYECHINKPFTFVSSKLCLELIQIIERDLQFDLAKDWAMDIALGHDIKVSDGLRDDLMESNTTHRGEVLLKKMFPSNEEKIRRDKENWAEFNGLVQDMFPDEKPKKPEEVVVGSSSVIYPSGFEDESEPIKPEDVFIDEKPMCLQLKDGNIILDERPLEESLKNPRPIIKGEPLVFDEHELDVLCQMLSNGECEYHNQKRH